MKFQGIRERVERGDALQQASAMPFGASGWAIPEDLGRFSGRFSVIGDSEPVGTGAGGATGAGMILVATLGRGFGGLSVVVGSGCGRVASGSGLR